MKLPNIETLQNGARKLDLLMVPVMLVVCLVWPSPYTIAGLVISTVFAVTDPTTRITNAIKKRMMATSSIKKA